jgi:type VI secretion system secreted protein Hcp
MASNMFIAITTTEGAVEGESKVTGFEKQIELVGWSWGVTQTGSAHSGTGGSTGVSKVSDLTFTAPIDKALPTLAQAAAKGVHLKTAILQVCKTGGEIVPYLKITLTGGLISGVQASGSQAHDATSVQTMSVSLNFSKIEMEYMPQAATGSAEGSTTGSIDVSQQA